MSNKLSLYTIEADKNVFPLEDAIWKEWYPKLQNYCQYLTQNKWDGEDIAHEAIFKALTKYSPDKITSALLNKIAYNYWIDLHRKRKKEKMYSETLNSSISILENDPASTVDLLITKFTSKQAIIFILKEAFQYQINEIADILQTTDMAVKSSLHRAKKRLESQSDVPLSLETYWEKEEREQLSQLFYESLVDQDPSELIKAVPSFCRINASPMVNSYKTQTPFGTLCMAA